MDLQFNNGSEQISRGVLFAKLLFVCFMNCLLNTTSYIELLHQHSRFESTIPQRSKQIIINCHFVDCYLNTSKTYSALGVMDEGDVYYNHGFIKELTYCLLCVLGWR